MVYKIECGQMKIFACAVFGVFLRSFKVCVTQNCTQRPTCNIDGTCWNNACNWTFCLGPENSMFSWDDAKSACKSYDAQLASISSAGEYECIKDERYFKVKVVSTLVDQFEQEMGVSQDFITNLDINAKFWIGARVVWAWSDGKTTSWLADTLGPKDCGRIESNGLMSHDCSHNQHLDTSFICQKQITTLATSQTSTALTTEVTSSTDETTRVTPTTRKLTSTTRKITFTTMEITSTTGKITSTTREQISTTDNAPAMDETDKDNVPLQEIDKKSTLKWKRRQTSADDDRASSIGMGVCAAAVITGVVVITVVLDFSPTKKAEAEREANEKGFKNKLSNRIIKQYGDMTKNETVELEPVDPEDCSKTTQDKWGTCRRNVIRSEQ